MRVYIAQILCPLRHCIIASVGEYESDEAAAALGDIAREHFAGLVEKGVAKPGCGICHSTQLTVEVGRSVFATMEEARPYLQASEANQGKAREQLKAQNN
jgi:hypothetical protein